MPTNLRANPGKRVSLPNQRVGYANVEKNE